MAVSMNANGMKLLPRTNETSENKPGEMGDPIVLADDVRKKFSAKTELGKSSVWSLSEPLSKFMSETIN